MLPTLSVAWHCFCSITGVTTGCLQTTSRRRCPMRWTWIAVLVGGGVGLLAPDPAHAAAWRYTKHFHLPPVYECHTHLSRSGSRKDMSFETLRSEEHTSELQSRPHLVCRLLLEKKKKLMPSLRATRKGARPQCTRVSKTHVLRNSVQ